MCKTSSSVSWLARVEIFLIQTVYRPLFSPFLGQQCRFLPTCSRYGEQALEKYGFFHGNLKIAWRILRCHPFSQGGCDPV